MGKLILETQTSVDGYMGATDGEVDWLVWPWAEDWTWDEELRRFHEELIGSCGITLLSSSGRQMIEHWEPVANQPDNPQRTFARSIVDSEHVLFSRSPREEQAWPGARFAQRSLSEEVDALKEGQADMIAFGGSGFVQSLLAEDLVDDLYLLVNPTALGDGIRVFPKSSKPFPLQLVDATAYPCGVVVQHYTATPRQALGARISPASHRHP